MLQQTHTVLNNGLQSFAEASPDYEFAPVGIGSMQEQAKKLAEYGRNGDIYVVHAAEGETVIPLEVLNANPKIKELLFGQMRGMGLDPQEFVVGNELNSINPDTGLPEFFFKSVFRSVKKAVKSVVKFAKKAAPIAIPIAAAAFGIPFLGPMFGAGTFGASFIGGGIGSLIGGGSIKDSLKAGAISGGIASLSAGAMGLFSKAPGSSFGGSFKSSFTGKTPIYNVVGDKLVQQGTKYAASPFADVPGNLMGGASDAAKASRAASDAQFNNLFGSGRAIDTITGEGAPFGEPVKNIKVSTDPFDEFAIYENRPGYDTLGSGESYKDFFGNEAKGFIPKAVAVPKSSSLSSRASDLLFGATPPKDKIFEEATKLKQTGLYTGEQAIAEATEQLSPKLFGSTTARKVLPTAALGLGATAVLGGFNTPEVKDVTRADLQGSYDPFAASKLIAAKPEDYRIPVAGLNPTFFAPKSNPGIASRFAADGGYIEKPQDMNRGGTPQFPRREMLIEGPGTETSDDIPAMLSDGEFVMNAQAVRGADPSGNGNRKAGARNLYDMMRNFEMRA